jgi:integrase
MPDVTGLPLPLSKSVRERIAALSCVETVVGLTARRTGADWVRATGVRAITLPILTGCRRGEVLGLQWQDVRGTGSRCVTARRARPLTDKLPRYRNNP